MLKIVSLALAAAAFAPSVLAQPAPEGSARSSGWAFAAGTATDNRSKNASKSGTGPFVYGLAEWENADGFFYAGTGVETIRADGADVEHDLNAGIRPTFAGFDVDVNVAHKWQVEADPGVDDDAFEFTANVSRSIGPAEARLQVQHTPNGTGAVRQWTWVEAQVGWDFTDRLSATAAVGRREQVNSVDYTGWNAGVTYALSDGADIDLRWFDTDAGDDGEQYEGALVAGLNLYF